MPVQNTGACFVAFVPKYWSFACRLCAKLPVSGLLPSIVVACPTYNLPVIVFSMYANVSCRCMVAIASEMPSCDWMCCVVYQLTVV